MDNIKQLQDQPPLQPTAAADGQTVNQTQDQPPLQLTASADDQTANDGKAAASVAASVAEEPPLTEEQISKRPTESERNSQQPVEKPTNSEAEVP